MLTPYAVTPGTDPTYGAPGAGTGTIAATGPVGPGGAVPTQGAAAGAAGARGRRTPAGAVRRLRPRVARRRRGIGLRERVGPALQALGSAVAELLRTHMRRGAVSPHGMVLNWARARRICEEGGSALRTMCSVVESANLPEVGNAVSNHF